MLDNRHARSVSLLFVVVDTAGTIRQVSPELARTVGSQPENLVGRKLTGMPWSRELFAEGAVRAVEGGCFTADGGVQDVGHEALRADGIVPLLSAGNRIQGLLLYGVHAEATQKLVLDQSTRQFFALVQNIPQGVFCKDLHSVYQACNVAYAADLGLKPEEVVGRTEYDFHSPALAERFIEQDKRIIGSLRTECSEAIHFDRGQERLVYKVKTPIWDTNSAVQGVLGILWDITDRKRTERHLRRVVELQSASLELFAHAIRDPLSVMRGYTSLLNRAEMSGISAGDLTMIRAIQSSLDQIVDITESYLDVDRIEQTAWSLRTSVVGLDQLVRGAVDRFSEEALKKGLSFVVHVDPDVHVLGDEELLMTALSNLLSNAIRYSESGTITVAARSAVDEAILSVADQGRGIAEEDLPHIFRKFYRVLHQEPAVEGLGLGLSLVKSIVESHGGTVTVSSRLGGGSTFEVHLGRRVNATFPSAK